MKNEINITREQFFEFVKGKNEDEESESPKYFLDYFDNYKKSGKKARNNWDASFFMHLWFLHRKMYIYSVLILLFQVTFIFIFTHFCGFTSEIFNDSSFKATFKIIVFLIGILFYILLLRYSNYIYLLYANKKIREGILNRGTNMWIVWVLVWVYLINIFIPEPIFLVIKHKLLSTLQLA